MRVTASLRSASETHQPTTGLGPGFDAALQVSSVIGTNLQTFRDVLGESSDTSSGEVRTGPHLRTTPEPLEIGAPRLVRDLFE